MRKKLIYAAVILALLALVFGIVARRKGMSPGASIRRLKGEFDVRNVFINVADDVGQAVVAVSTERTQMVGMKMPRVPSRRFGRGSGGQNSLERFFEQFFSQMPEKEFKQSGLGTGFIIDKKGHVLTNYHVIHGAQKINVTLPDGREFKATVRGTDPRRDIAVIKINAKNVPHARLGDSDRVQVGEWVMALGNPFGHILKSPKPTVTVGVVSALHRRIPVPDGQSGYFDMIQTDAAINPGNSGGPLCDLNSEVIGINVALFSTSGGYQGVGFAIPINSVKDILDDLIAGKEIVYGWLGVSVQNITPEIARYFGLPDNKGALIAKTIPGSPAAKGDLKAGDIVKTYDGKDIVKVHDLLREIANTKVGRTVRMDIIRERAKKRVDIKIEKNPSKPEVEEEEEAEAPKEARRWRGMITINITDQIAHDLGIKDKAGVVIAKVAPSGAGYAAGLRKGDIVRGINRIRVRNLEDYEKLAVMAKGAALVRTDRGYFIVRNEKKQAQ